MHTVSFWRVGVVAIIFFLSASIPLFSFAAVGIDPQIPFSGTLKDAGGGVLTGTYNMEFRIYDVSAGGGALWSETFSNVVVTDGAFNVMLGSVASLASVNFNQPLYLGVKIGTDPEMTPRERIGASAYAFNADLLDGLHASSFMQTNVPIDIDTASENSLLTLTQTGTGNLMSIWSNTDEIFSILNDGTLGDVSFSGNIQTADGKGIRLGNSDGGISLYVDALNLDLGKNVLMLGAYGDAYSDSVDITASSSLSFTANAFNLNNQYDPSFSLGGDGFVTLTSSQSFDINAVSGVQVLTGGLSVWGDPSFFDAGIETGVGSVVLVGDQSEVRFGTVSEALTLKYDLANSNNLLFGLDNIPGGQTYLNLIAPGEMRFVSNGGDGTAPELTIVGGKVGIGNTNPQEALDVTGTIRSLALAGNGANIELYTDNLGNITTDPFSDERLKANIVTIDNALDMVLGLRGVRYEWKDTERFGTQKEVGFIAQEVQEIVPEVVRDTGEYFTLNIKNIVAVVVEAVKELNTKVEEYFTRTERLEREVADLHREIDALKGVSSPITNSEEVSTPVVVPEEVVPQAPVEEVVADPVPQPETIPEPIPEPEIPYVAE